MIHGSQNIDAYKTNCREQELDKDISWMKALLLGYKTNNSKISQFENTTKRILFKNYQYFGVMDGIVNRQVIYKILGSNLHSFGHRPVKST